MSETIILPLWIVFIICILAAWAVFSLVLLPLFRWIVKRRINRVIKEVNDRLDLQLPSFKLTKRDVLVDRLLYDDEVQRAVEEHCRDQGVSNDAAMQKVKRYSEEILPSFNAYIYFRLGNLIGRFFVRLLYRFRLGFADEEGLAKINPQSSVVFIMNHRSNMDYILLAYLAIHRIALSFAVGEWARVWPLEQLIRAMGAFFVRRGTGNILYRRVLARYVQMATDGGVVQAIFPEGKLSKDGRLGDPKIGLLDYLLRGFDSNKGRDLVFIPVGVNYDRVLEDRSQLLSINPDSKQKSRLRIIKTTLAFIVHNMWLMVRGRWYRFGYAVVNIGTPVSMREYVKKHNIDFQSLEKKVRVEKVKLLARDLMQAVCKVIPVVPVSLISYVFIENLDKALSELEIKTRAQKLIIELEKHGACVYIPRGDQDYTIEVGLRMLKLRHLVHGDGHLFRASIEEIKVLKYYANSISHFL
ncbi:MAG: 1-acyl-sn-glycerol-3-phosphate acyltransferase [Candidatus Aminicenantaceae bacterium]